MVELVVAFHELVYSVRSPTPQNRRSLLHNWMADLDLIFVGTLFANILFDFYIDRVI